MTLIFKSTIRMGILMKLKEVLDKWFTKIDEEQAKWGLSQLADKGLYKFPQFETTGDEPASLILKNTLIFMGDNVETHALIKKLRSGLSSKKYRALQRQNKSNINYWISKTAYKQLAFLRQSINATNEETIETLITDQYSLLKKQADEEKIRIKQEKAEKQRKRIRRFSGIDDAEILLANRKVVKSLQDSENNLKLELEALKLELIQIKEIAKEQRIKIAEYTVKLNSFDYLEEELDAGQNKAVQELIHNTNEEPKV